MKNEKKSPAKFFGIGKLVSGIAAKVSAAGGGLTGIKALAMANPLATAAVIAGGAYLYSKHKKKKAKEKRQQGLLSDAQADFNERLKQYENLDFKPIDIDALKQENLLEDLEIDASAVEASQRAFAQSQANILQSLRGVGGSTGAASLATALSGQAADQAEKMRLSIAEQINANRKLALQEQSRLNNIQKELQLANMEGARQFEIDQLTTLMGVDAQKIAGIRGDIAAQQERRGQIFGAVGSIIGSGIGSGEKDPFGLGNLPSLLKLPKDDGTLSGGEELSPGMS